MINEIKNVLVDWAAPIPVAHFNGELTFREKITGEYSNVIYIFEGISADGKQKGIDVGQTSNTLYERTRQHIVAKDYLEGFPNQQYIRCGKVRFFSNNGANKQINRELLEQIEGEIISYFKSKISFGYELCNSSKTKEYKKTYKQLVICNIGANVLLPEVISYAED